MKVKLFESREKQSPNENRLTRPTRNYYLCAPHI
jgi:hypothetical protein